MRNDFKGGSRGGAQPTSKGAIIVHLPGDQLKIARGRDYGRDQDRRLVSSENPAKRSLPE